MKMETIIDDDRGFKGIWIPKEIWTNEELSITEKCLWAEIDSLDKNGKGCYKKNKTLASSFNCTENHISKMISHLIDIGLVYQSKFDGRLRYLKTRLIKNDYADYDQSKTSTQTNQKNKNSIIKNDYSLYNIEESTKKNNIEDNNNCVAEEIYNLYPRKVSKKMALIAIEKALKKYDAEFIKNKTMMYAELSSWKSKEYIPHPSTWFNQERFNDNPEEWKQPNQGFKNKNQISEQGKQTLETINNKSNRVKSNLEDDAF